MTTRTRDYWFVQMDNGDTLTFSKDSETGLLLGSIECPHGGGCPPMPMADHFEIPAEGDFWEGGDGHPDGTVIAVHHAARLTATVNMETGDRQ